MKVFIKLADYIRERGIDCLFLLLVLFIWVWAKVFHGKEVNN